MRPSIVLIRAAHLHAAAGLQHPTAGGLLWEKHRLMDSQSLPHQSEQGVWPEGMGLSCVEGWGSSKSKQMEEIGKVMQNHRTTSVERGPSRPSGPTHWNARTLTAPSVPQPACLQGQGTTTSLGRMLSDSNHTKAASRGKPLDSASWKGFPAPAVPTGGDGAMPHSCLLLPSPSLPPMPYSNSLVHLQVSKLYCFPVSQPI